MLSNKEVDADDRKDGKDEDLEDADIENSGNRVYERFHELPHPL